MAQSNISKVSRGGLVQQKNGADLRNFAREPVSGWDATLYCSDTTHYDGSVVDSSSDGAGLVMSCAPCPINTDDEITVTIRIGARKITRRAIVRWAQPEKDKRLIGIQFIDHVGLNPEEHILDVGSIRINPTCALKIPPSIAMRRRILPFLEMNGVVHVACGNTGNIGMNSSIERMLKSPVCNWQAETDELDKVLKQVYGNAASQAIPLPTGKAAKVDNGAAVDLGNELLYAAYVRQASDIHVDPSYKGAKIRFRVDGQLELYENIKSDAYVELASRLKIMAGLDIAEKRSPQDGRFTHAFAGGSRRIDIRVATLPTKYGERITMRLLSVQTESLTLGKLGFTGSDQDKIENFLQRIQGMMILTGPTGSGKTTTLYAAIRMLLEERNVNIITVEDPIEYEIAGVAQCEVDTVGDKVDFARALRSILRHDPDVVMIGEIRDKETADIAIKASLTGHMVLGTLHTNSAAASVTRLIDMGVEPYLVGAALRLAVAQRLLRRLCKHCRIPRALTEAEAAYVNSPELAGHQVYEPSGCIYCGNRGYSGRIGLYELLELNTDWARAVTEGEGESELLTRMRKAGIKSLLQDALSKLISGETSYQEVLQIASSW